MSNASTSSAQRLLGISVSMDSPLDTPFLGGNELLPLVNGETAYPAMLESIYEARSSIALSTYMFADDPLGVRFVEALISAISQKVEVRVIVDSFGALLSWPPIQRLLSRGGVKYASFKPLWNPVNLRSRYHRKLLIVDGRVGFAGGMNIRQHHLVNEPSSCPTADIQFRIEGPIVAEMQAIFANDWHMATGEVLAGCHWFPELSERGTTRARAVPSGPKHSVKSRCLILHAVTCAKYEVRIATPYFFPDPRLVRALKDASRRGVGVEVIVPRETWFLFRWAFTPILLELIESGCQISLSVPPFDHSKILIIDGIWAFVGSTNWDGRSFSANYEFDIESYCEDFSLVLTRIMDDKRALADSLTLDMLMLRGRVERIRDRVASIMLPFL